MQASHLRFRFTLFYLSFFIIVLVSIFYEGYRLVDERGPVRNAGVLLLLQLAGIQCFSIGSWYISEFSFKEIFLGKVAPSLLPVIVLLLMILITVLFTLSQSNAMAEKIIHNQVAIKKFSFPFLIQYFLFRLLFISCYEIFFRGYLLFISIYYVGVVWGILINVTLYALLHLPGTRKEAIGCIPFGIVLCGICIWFNAVFPAVILHLSLSVVYEINLTKKLFNPKKRFI